MHSPENNRLVRILDAVVSSYIRHGRPVGSRYIYANFDIGLRSASIRSSLAELEGLGLLAKPHVSAGRVPTDKAFRWYLNTLDGGVAPGRREVSLIRNAMDPDISVDELLERVSRLLGDLSKQIGVAVLPGSGQGMVSRMETAGSEMGRLTVTVTIEPGMQRSINLIPYPDMSLEETMAEITRMAGFIMGKRIGEARRIIGKLRLQSQRRGIRFEELWAALEYLLRDRGCGVHLSGTGNVVSELSDEGDLKSFLEALESKQTVADMLLSGTSEEGPRVRLGSETAYDPFRRCGIISSTYRIGTTRGALGIIGPVRMDYPRLMAVLEFTSDQLSRLFAERGGERRSAAEKKKRRRRARN